MKSMQNNLIALKNILLTVRNASGNPVPVYHYLRPVNVQKDYIVWAEDSEDESFEANNAKQEQQIHCTVDYFTQTEFDPAVDSIQEALNGDGIGFRLNSVQYEDDTKLIHYEWEVWVS